MKALEDNLNRTEQDIAGNEQNFPSDVFVGKLYFKKMENKRFRHQKNYL